MTMELPALTEILLPEFCICVWPFILPGMAGICVPLFPESGIIGI